jgi:ubiquinol-cytochrome c reductase cytochrome b subunit
VVLSVPLVGTWIAFLIFGGDFPGTDVITRFFVIHILIVPAAIAGLLVAHLGILIRQKHSQFAGKGRTNTNVVGARLWPTFMAKTLGLFFIVFAVLAALAGLAQINPVWIWGPFEPAAVSAGSQPDWYVGWLEGSLRLFPAWETRLFGFEIPNPFYSGVLIPSVTFGVLYAWPFLEARMTKDYAEHHILDRPRDRPVRTGIGVAVLTFFVLLFLAGGNDVLAARFGISVNQITWALRIAVLTLPFLAFWLTHRLCRELQARERAQPPAVSVLERGREGGFTEVEPTTTR